MGVYLGTADVNLFCGQPDVEINNQDKTVTPSGSEQTITADAGHGYTGLGTVTVEAMPSGSATPASSISGQSATVSSPSSNKIMLTQTVSNTPQVSAGYISSGTAGNSSVSLTGACTTKDSTTYYASTSDQTIGSGTYITGTQTFKGVTTSNITASNIKSGVVVKVGDSADDDRILSVTGSLAFVTYYTGSSTPSSSLGSNGDIYLQE